MRLIDRYLLRQMLGPTLLAVAALSAVALLSNSLSVLDYLVNQRQSALVLQQSLPRCQPQTVLQQREINFCRFPGRLRYRTVVL